MTQKITYERVVEFKVADRNMIHVGLNEAVLNMDGEKTFEIILDKYEYETELKHMRKGTRIKINTEMAVWKIDKNGEHTFPKIVSIGV